MSFWSFSKISPPAPNDPTVDVDTQLNDNWDLAETILSTLITNPMPNTLLNAEIGQEWIYNGRLGVWDGANLIFPQDIEAGWSAWQNLSLIAPAAARISFTPKWRVNTLIGQIQLSGGVTYNNAAWPASFTEFCAEASGSGIPIIYKPNGGTTYIPATTSIPSVANRAAAVLIAVDVPGAGPSVRLRARFMGGSGGGNFVALDGVRWYY